MDPRIERTLFYIEQNIARPVSLDKLADIACLTPHHFHRLFKKEMGETPKAYTDRVRIEHIAHMMVVRKDLNITDVAFDYDYSSPAAFTRAFKAIYNVTPRTFRDNVREQHKERLEKHWANLEEDENFKPRKLELRHMPAKRLKATRILMQENLLNDAYRKLITENTGRVSHGITIYTEGPFRPDRDTVRIHVALDEAAPDQADAQILELQAGYYHQRKVIGDFDAMTDAMYKSFQRDIEPSRYNVGTTTFYERVPLPASPDGFDYFSTERIVFGCLIRR